MAFLGKKNYALKGQNGTLKGLKTQFIDLNKHFFLCMKIRFKSDIDYTRFVR